jgi:hypothetical protein
LDETELERLCKEAVMTYFTVLSWHLPGLRKIMENLSETVGVLTKI